MTTYFRDLFRALPAELLKLRRTLSLELAFIAPIVIVLLNVAVYWQRGNGATVEQAQRDVWVSLANNNLLFWNLLLVPLFVTLQTALLGQIEHAHKNWKHLFALPISRGAVYTAKQIVALALMGLSTAVLWFGLIASGMLLRVLRPGMGFEADPPLGQIATFVVVSYFTSWLIVAVHAWIGMRWPSFVVASTVGIVATVAAVIVIQSEYPIYYPWTLPAALTMDLIRTGTVTAGWVLVGFLGGIVAAVAGGLDFVRRDVL